MRFLLDAQLPPALARLIADLGHSAVHVSEIGLLEAADRTVWDHAVAESTVIISKDQDFAQRRAVASIGPRVVWLRIGNMRRAALFPWFRSVFPDIIAALERGEVIVEVR